MANYANIQNFGNPLDPDWRKNNLVTVTAPNGQQFTVYKDAAPNFTNLLKDLDAAGVNIKSDGGFNYRNIAGTDKLSQHAFGNAIDINANTNQRGTAGTMPANTADIAARNGFEWGGNWKNPDPMHFEWKGPSDNSAPTVVANNAASNAPAVNNTAAINPAVNPAPGINFGNGLAVGANGQAQYNPMGLLSSSMGALQAGAPKQTWQPGAPAPVHRPQDYANIFGGLLGGYYG